MVCKKKHVCFFDSGTSYPNEASVSMTVAMHLRILGLAQVCTKAQNSLLELDGLVFQVEADNKLKSKKKDLVQPVAELEAFVKDLKKVVVLLQQKADGMDEKQCGKEIENLKLFVENASEHLDQATALTKRVRGWVS